MPLSKQSLLALKLDERVVQTPPVQYEEMLRRVGWNRAIDKVIELLEDDTKDPSVDEWAEHERKG